MGVYKIGTNHASLTLLSALSPSVLDPRGMGMDYAESPNLCDGTRQGQGWLIQTWHWDVISEAQWNKIISYAGSANVYTRNNSGSFAEYTCIVVTPEKEPEHYDNYVIDANIELRGLVAV